METLKLFLLCIDVYTAILLGAILSSSEIHSVCVSTPMQHSEDVLHADGIRSCETNRMLYKTWLEDSYSILPKITLCVLYLQVIRTIT